VEVMKDCSVLIACLVAEGFQVKVGSPDTADFQVDVTLEDGFIVCTGVATTLDLAVTDAFLDAPDLEEARQQAADAIPF
jgi:hypothetical protein